LAEAAISDGVETPADAIVALASGNETSLFFVSRHAVIVRRSVTPSTHDNRYRGSRATATPPSNAIMSL
jgi:hypothetical protein